jgi:hypothetical protein
VEALLARTDELARRWAIGLILALPLERIGEVPLETFADEAPLLCAQAVRALASEEELERIARPADARGAAPPARRLAEMTGARDGTAAVEAIEALRGVLWRATLDELRWSGFGESVSARMVADLADRLAYVCSVALVSSFAEAPAGQASARAARTAAYAESAATGAQIARAGAQAARAGSGAANAGAAGAPGELATAATGAAAAPQAVPAGRVRRAALGNGVVIVDEAGPAPRRSQSGSRTAPPARSPAGSGSPPRGPDARRTGGRPLPWDTPLERPANGRDERP